MLMVPIENSRISLLVWNGATMNFLLRSDARETKVI
jgi:hypothetical protein